MEQVWRQAPMPAVRVRDEAGAAGWEPNDAARQWLRDSGVAESELRALFADLHVPGDADRLLAAPHLTRLRCRVVALEGGRLIWFVPDTLPPPRPGREGEADLIERALYMADVSVWWVDADMRHIHFIRRGATAIGGGGDVFHVPLSDHRAQIHPDDVPAVARAAEQALRENRVADAMVRYRLPRGSWRTLLTRRIAQRAADGGLLGLLGISVDLSDLAAERERSLRLSDRIRLAAETIGLGFWSRNVADGPVEWDDQMFRLHHRDPAQGAPSLDEWLERHVHALDRDWMRERQLQSQANWPTVDDLMFRIPVPGSDDVRWIHARTRRLVRDGQRVSFGVHVDVTEQELARLALERERERIGLVLEAAGVGVWERRLDGRPSYLSDVGYRLRGREPSPLPMEEVIAESIDPSDRAAGEAAWLRNIEQGETYRHEYRVRWPNGEQRWLASFGRAVRDSAARSLYVAGIDIDVTERHVAEAVAREHLRAEQASRAKTEFLARMSHELRTPLNAVLGFTTLLMHDRDEPPSARQQERLARIETAGRKLLLMIDEVLDLAGDDTAATALMFEPVALDELIHECMRRSAAAARESGIELRAAPPLAGRVLTDRVRAARVLEQLIDNGIRFNWPGGLVELRTGFDERDDMPGWVIALRDNGRGMSLGQVQAAFEPFQRLGTEQEGIDGPGIGLAIVRRYVERLRGRVEVASEPGRGSEFRVWLPQAPVEAAVLPVCAPPVVAPALVPAVAPAPAAEPGRLRVLCVEDNPVNLLLLREVFGMRPSMAVEMCEDGTSAIERAGDFAPEVVLLDLQLPDLPGLEVMRRLRADARHAHCRFIALSANAMPDDVQAARAAGFDDYWTKPIDVRRFLTAIDGLVDAAAVQR